MNKILKSVQAEMTGGPLAGNPLEDEARHLAAHRGQLSYFYKLCEKYYRPGAKFLDIGSSYGYSCLGARMIGYEAYGLDTADNVERFAPRFGHFNIENIAADLTAGRSPFSSRKFDLILVSDIPETVDHNPAQFFNELNRLLKPGGRLMITARNLLRFNNLARIFLSSKKAKSKPAPADYYCEFTASELSYLLTKNGLNVEKIKYHNPGGQGIDWLARLFNYVGGIMLPHRKASLVVTARK